MRACMRVHALAHARLHGARAQTGLFHWNGASANTAPWVWVWVWVRSYVAHVYVWGRAAMQAGTQGWKL